MHKILEMMASDKTHDELEATVFEYLYEMHLKYRDWFVDMVSSDARKERLKLEMEMLIKANGDTNILNHFNSFDFSTYFYSAYRSFYLCFKKKPKISKAEYENRLRHLCVDLANLDFFDRFNIKLKSDKYFVKSIYFKHEKLFDEAKMEVRRRNKADKHAKGFDPIQVIGIERLFIEECKKTIESNLRLTKKRIFITVLEKWQLSKPNASPNNVGYKQIDDEESVQEIIDESENVDVKNLYEKFTHSKFKKKNQ